MKRTLFVNITIYAMAAAGLILVVFPVRWFPSFYDVRYMGWVGLIEAVLIGLLPLSMLVPDSAPGADKKNNAARSFQFLLAFTFLGNALGDLGLYQLYKVGFQFDKLLHFCIPFLLVAVFTIILQDRFKVRRSYAIFFAFVLALACGVGWEVFEFVADHIANTHISGLYGFDVLNDTKWDLTFDVFGSACGALASVFMPNAVRKTVTKVSGRK